MADSAPPSEERAAEDKRGKNRDKYPQKGRGDTALHAACLAGHPNIVRLLAIENNAKVDMRSDSDGASKSGCWLAADADAGRCACCGCPVPRLLRPPLCCPAPWARCSSGSC